MPRRTTPRALITAALFVVILCGCSAHEPAAAAEAPAAQSALEFTGYVVDQAGLLSKGQRETLTKELGAFEHRTGHQFAVVTVTSLRGQDVSGFTTELANNWGVGRKGLNDGVVLLVAPHERKVRIAVGRGLEHQLTDAFCSDLIERAMVPRFTKHDFGSGIQAGVTAIVAQLSRTEPNGK